MTTLLLTDSLDSLEEPNKKATAFTVAQIGTNSDLGESDNSESNNANLSDALNLYKYIGASMSKRFIKFIPGETSQWLQENYPNAFLLLCQIASRARRTSGHIDGMTIGMAYIGDFKKAGIQSEGKYREAKKTLIRFGFIKIVETNRKNPNQKKADNDQKIKNIKNATTSTTTSTTTKGTVVCILKSDIWDINPETETYLNNDLNNDLTTTLQRPDNDEQEGIRMKKEDKKESVCPNSPSPAVPVSKVKKRSPDGKEVEAHLDDFYRKVIFERKDYTTQEIAEVWDILVKTNELIRDPYHYMEGTIKNLRTKRQFEKMKTTNEKQKEKTPCQPQKNLISSPMIDLYSLRSQN